MAPKTTGAIVRAVEPALISRASGLAGSILNGGFADTFFGPGAVPAAAAPPELRGRRFDYPVGYNQNYRPRAYEAVDFATLRALADNYDIVRLAIETRKDQMGKLEWSVVRRDNGKDDATSKEIKEFLQEPDRENDFLTWMRAIHEDLFTIDASTVYIWRTKGGKPFSLDYLDGATITPKIDDRGRSPLPPEPAYEQIIKGLPAWNYDRNELVYAPRNRRTHKVYGYSPVEQILMIVNIGLRREIFQLQYYTEGNVPEMLMTTPANWDADQIGEWQSLFDQVMAGDTAAKRRIRFVPHEAKPYPTRAEPLFDQFDEWIARVVCYAFNLAPTAFVKQMNRATAEGAQEVALIEGLSPVMEWQKRFMNRIIRTGWNTKDYEFIWQDEQDIDPKVQAEIDVMYSGGTTGTATKIRSVQEIRDDHDWGPLPADLQAEADAALEAKVNPPAPPPIGGDVVGDEPDPKDKTSKEKKGAVGASEDSLKKARSLRQGRQEARRPPY